MYKITNGFSSEIAESQMPMAGETQAE